MSKFKVFLIVGGAVGILAGGTVALVMSSKNPPPASISQPATTRATPVAAIPAPAIPTPAPSPAAAPVVPAMPASASASAGAGTREPAAAPKEKGNVPARTQPKTVRPTGDEKAANKASAAALNEDGKKLLFTKRYVEAEALFRRSFELDPQPPYLLNLGLDLFQQGKFEESLGEFHRLQRLKLTPLERTKAEKLSKLALEECQKQGMACGGSQ